MNIRSKEEFSNQEVILDFTHFKKCTFEDCTMEYRGTGPIQFAECDFDDCDWVLRGPAQRTAHFIQQQYATISRAMVLNLFAQLTQGDMMFRPIEIDGDAHLVADLGVIRETEAEEQNVSAEVENNQGRK